MRYVVVCDVGGEGGQFNNKLRREVYEKLGVKSSSLPAHFTIKAPFEKEGSIEELENLLDSFCKTEHAAPFTLNGYDHFEDRVIYMHVDMSEEGQIMHNRLIDRMSEIPYILFDKKDGKDKIFHVTVSSKKVAPIYNILWQYVHQYPCHYECMFDNISIYRWDHSKWILHKRYELK